MKEDVPAAAAGSAVVARPAASLLVMQHDVGQPRGAPPPSGPGGPHRTRLLMARRNKAHRFMPNVLVFPGGAVDAADYHARVASPLKPSVRARLERGVEPRLAQALACAAARELTEEVGLSLGDPPDLQALDYLCRAITPPDRSMRFDAHFFLVHADAVRGELRASDELEDPGWYTVEEALEGELAAATKAVLAQFQRWLTWHDRDGPVPVLRDRVWTHE